LRKYKFQIARFAGLNGLETDTISRYQEAGNAGFISDHHDGDCRGARRGRSYRIHALVLPEAHDGKENLPHCLTVISKIN
jgi:hypothetical protein